MSMVELKRGAPQVARSGPPRPELSVIIPLFEEEANVSPLMRKLFDALDNVGVTSEVIAVDDGSRDGTLAELRVEARRRPQLKIVSLCRNYGQTAALMAGFDHAAGEVIISMDADLQNDPADIPILLDKLNEGYDVVSGWRKDRKDAKLRRNFVSRVANRLISRISNVHLQDYGCTLKAYRADVMQGVRLYGEMHRFIPIYASWMGARVAEVPVRHHPRAAGRSKYGLERAVKVLLDLLVIKFLDRYFVKPIYVFGGFGLLCLTVSALALMSALYLKLFEGVALILTPLPLLSAMTFLIGMTSLLMGLLGEMLMRTYFESQRRAAYVVREVIAGEAPSTPQPLAAS